jgi:uncharacterized membrane protein
MKVKGLLIVSLLLVAAMTAFAFYTAGLLPEGAQLPTRFDGAGNPVKYMDALPALMINPIALLAISLILAATPFIEPLQDRLEGSAPLLRVAWIGLMAMLVVVQLVIAAPAFGYELHSNIIMIGVGVMFVLIGNVLPKSRPGFFVGIRTPWTITDTDNWIATHRLGGKLMMLAGIVMIIAPLSPIPAGASVLLTIGAILVAALVPIVYSWYFWHRKKQAAGEG